MEKEGVIDVIIPAQCIPGSTPMPEVKGRGGVEAEKEHTTEPGFTTDHLKFNGTNSTAQIQRHCSISDSFTGGTRVVAEATCTG